MAHPLIWLLHMALDVLSILLIVYIVLQWLVHFKIINIYQPFVSQIMQGLHRLLEPLLRYIRRYLPRGPGIDFSPIVLFILIEFAQYCLVYYVN